MSDRARRSEILFAARLAGGLVDYRAEVERALDEHAAHLEKHVDCDAIFAAAR